MHEIYISSKIYGFVSLTQLRIKNFMKSEMKGGLGKCVSCGRVPLTTAKRYGVTKVRASEKGVKFERVQSCYYDTCASDQVSFQTKLEVFHLYHMELCIYTVHLVSRHWDIRHQPGEDPLQKSAHSLQDLLQHNIHSIILRELMFWNINIMLRMSLSFAFGSGSDAFQCTSITWFIL